MCGLRCGFYCSLIIAVCSTSCNHPLTSEGCYFTFGVVDVGQGLSQIGISGSQALVWDMGPPEGYAMWKDCYVKENKPELISVIISHRDLDHSGGLYFLDSSINWNGVLITSKYEDTAAIKGMCRSWRKPIRLRLFGRGDTLLLNNTRIECVWPPHEIDMSEPVQGAQINKYSLVFLVRFNETQVLITSDIDSASMQTIAENCGILLRSQLVVVPHHGSRFSSNRLFYGLAQPEIAIISCGKQNAYGHPSPEIISLLMTMCADVRVTFLERSCFFRSNGFYWSEEK